MSAEYQQVSIDESRVLQLELPEFEHEFSFDRIPMPKEVEFPVALKCVFLAIDELTGREFASVLALGITDNDEAIVIGAAGSTERTCSSADALYLSAATALANHPLTSSIPVYVALLRGFNAQFVTVFLRKSHPKIRFLGTFNGFHHEPGIVYTHDRKVVFYSLLHHYLVEQKLGMSVSGLDLSAPGNPKGLGFDEARLILQEQLKYTKNLEEALVDKSKALPHFDADFLFPLQLALYYFHALPNQKV